MVALLVITASWLLNACMDAIDHGKGAQTLGVLWHVLKWFSYALPFGYICYMVRMHILLVILLGFVLMCAWEFVYRYLRHIDFYKHDKWIL